MQELTEQNAAEILHAAGHIADPQQVRVRELSGGVSNVVLLIEQPAAGPGPERFVVKQARGKLRVQADWRCSIERIWREVEVLQTCAALLREGNSSIHNSVPEVYWTDRNLYAYSMTAADANCRTWKEQLLSGECSSAQVIRFASLLGTIHAGSWHDVEIARRFADRSYFVQLRLEPYYRYAASRYQPLATPLQELAERTWAERHCLVHGDFSPKNLLISDGKAMLIDFEVGHYGDPAFDVGFFLCHLALKAIHLPQHAETLVKMLKTFWACYLAIIARKASPPDWKDLSHRIGLNLAGCLASRVHGKSPVDYLTEGEQLRAVQVAESIFELGPDADFETTCEILRSEILID
jgi:5-methylthioribose kinase